LNQSRIKVAVNVTDQSTVGFDGRHGIAFMNQTLGQKGAYTAQTQYQYAFRRRPFFAEHICSPLVSLF
jgi:hypothetical protein